MEPLLLIGTDYRLVHPSRLGEVEVETLVARLRRARRDGRCAGFVVLATCNRIEIYLDRGSKDAATRRWLPERLLPALPVFEKEGADAARHLMCVAASLESMVLGENQIHGQVKLAWQDARAEGTSSRLLDELLRAALECAREIRSLTGLGTQPVSVASLAAQAARARLAPGARVALIGAGTMARKAARTFAKDADLELVVANRTLERAAQLAGECGGTAISLHELLSDPPAVDAVFVAIRGGAPLVDEGLVDALQRARGGQSPLLVLDVGVPAAVTPAAGRRDDVHLIDMDELERTSRSHAREREAAAQAALPIVEARVEKLLRRVRQRDLDLGAVRQAHLELTEQYARSLGPELQGLSEGLRQRLLDGLRRIAKAHAHLHLKDVKQRVAAGA